jgi:transcriptional regulator of acetoin/glycerol metabolism
MIRSTARARPPAKASSANTPNTPTTAAQEQAETAWPLTLDQVIKQTLVRLLRETAGNRRRTASLLGISRSTLYRMLARYNIDHVGRVAPSHKPGVGPSGLSA